MSKHGTIRRYSLIIEKIKGGQYPSFQEIKDHLFRHGFENSKRTIQRDIEQIRFEFGIEIMYSRHKDGYFIDYESSPDFESYIRFFGMVTTAELFTDSLKRNSDLLKYISFDAHGELKGIENLKHLLQAVKENRKITFTHFNFHTNKTSEYTLEPYLLKQYENRWYIIGITENLNEFRTFGIDRIYNLEVKPEAFKRDNRLNPSEIFDSTIGLVYSANKPQKVVLSFTPTQGNYIKTLPLHKSQQIINDDETELRISLFVVPNYELNQLILKHGDTVKVIEPKWLANEIKENLKRTLKKYK